MNIITGYVVSEKTCVDNKISEKILGIHTSSMDVTCYNLEKYLEENEYYSIYEYDRKTRKIGEGYVEVTFFHNGSNDWYKYIIREQKIAM